MKDDITGGVECNNKIDYFLAGSDTQADMERSANLAKVIHWKFADAFSDIVCFKKHIFISAKRWCKTIPSATMSCNICTSRALQEGAGEITKQQIIIPLQIDEITEWYDSFVLVVQPNGTVWLGLDLARLMALILQDSTRHSSDQDTEAPLSMIYFLDSTQQTCVYNLHARCRCMVTN